MPLRVLASAALLMLIGLPSAPAASRHPNVIIVLTDDQGYGDLSGHGNPVLRTPHMDALRAEAVRLTDFHVDSYCSPTRAALMTGRYAHRVGVWRTVIGRNMLRDGETTMAEVFRHNGYRTGHFGKWHLGGNYPYRPIDRGFDRWLGHGDGGTGCATDFWGNDRVNDVCIDNGNVAPREGFEADVFFNEAMRFVRQREDAPFFVYLATYNPHSPCSIPDRSWADPYRGKIPVGTACFFATIARLDENLGRLRKFLRDEGLADNTILLFLTDNGTAAGEKVFNAGMRGKKGSQYDGGHRVPCFIHWPAGGLDRPVDVNRLTAHVDLLPTLIDLCDLKPPKEVAFDGRSLKPLLNDPQAAWPDRTLVLGTPVNNTASAAPPKAWERCAVMTDRWRLVDGAELFDMAADPGQKTDLAKAYPDVVAQLREAYQRYWADVSRIDRDWQGRPIVGSPHQLVTRLASEAWTPTEGPCPWSQASVAAGRRAVGYWPIRVAQTGSYQIELRRWPRELSTPIAGVPPKDKSVDAWLNDKPVDTTLYAAVPRALPVEKARLKIGNVVREAAVAADDQSVLFDVDLQPGPVDVATWLLDRDGNTLCSAFYVYIRRTP